MNSGNGTSRRSPPARKRHYANRAWSGRNKGEGLTREHSGVGIRYYLRYAELGRLSIENCATRTGRRFPTNGAVNANFTTVNPVPASKCKFVERTGKVNLGTDAIRRTGALAMSGGPYATVSYAGTTLTR